MSNSKSNNGNKPAKVAKSSVKNPFDFGALYENPLMVPEVIKSDIKKRGWDFRWGNLTKYKRDGMHRTGWRPYKRPADMKTEFDSLVGTHPDGYVITGDCVLMVKETAAAEAMRQKIRARTKMQAGETMKQAAEQLRDTFRSAGQDDARVYEGFEEDAEGKGARDLGDED